MPDLEDHTTNTTKAVDADLGRLGHHRNGDEMEDVLGGTPTILGNLHIGKLCISHSPLFCTWVCPKKDTNPK